MCRQSAYMMERRRSKDQELEDGREEKDLLRERMTERRVPSFPGDETEQKELSFKQRKPHAPLVSGAEALERPLNQNASAYLDSITQQPFVLVRCGILMREHCYAAVRPACNHRTSPPRIMTPAMKPSMSHFATTPLAPIELTRRSR